MLWLSPPTPRAQLPAARGAPRGLSAPFSSSTLPVQPGKSKSWEKSLGLSGTGLSLGAGSGLLSPGVS